MIFPNPVAGISATMGASLKPCQTPFYCVPGLIPIDLCNFTRINII